MTVSLLIAHRSSKHKFDIVEKAMARHHNCHRNGYNDMNTFKKP